MPAESSTWKTLMFHYYVRPTGAALICLEEMSRDTHGQTPNSNICNSSQVDMIFLFSECMPYFLCRPSF
jgi:hypothetical protein